MSKPHILAAGRWGSKVGQIGQHLGRVFADLPVPNDGTVCVEETRLLGGAAELVLDVSHTGMLFSSAVADATRKFLQRGSFPDGD